MGARGVRGAGVKNASGFAFFGGRSRTVAEGSQADQAVCRNGGRKANIRKSLQLKAGAEASPSFTVW
jgi:hypothetical protein